MKKSIIITGVIIIAAIAVALLLFGQRPAAGQPVPGNQPATSTAAGAAATSTPNSSGLVWPIGGALARVTKKPFGIYVSPGHSPINPERFTGYHTGVDFETTAAEKDTDVPIYAICAGPLALKEIASGYGGVAVQSCTINKEPVTVIYGHLRLTSIKVKAGTKLNPGQQIGVLGTGYSTETGGERKHLHLGIHKGAAIDLLGYVATKSQLSPWLDFLSLMK